MAEEEQKKQLEEETNAIRDMINEGGLGADIYYIYNSTEEDAKIKA